MRALIAIWATARDVWEVPGSISLFSEHLAVFSETWPTSGMTRDGSAYALPMSAPRMDDSGSSSLLQTPSVADSLGGHRTRDGGRSGELLLAGQALSLLPTPEANTASNGGSQHPDKRRAGGHSVNLQDVTEHLLPTPTTTQRGPDANLDTRAMAGPNLHNAVHLLPTPTATPYGNNQSPSPGAVVRPSLDSLAKLLPTPTAMDSHSSGGNNSSNVTLTDAVVRTSLGARTNPRLDDGNQSSDAPLQLPLS